MRKKVNQIIHSCHNYHVPNFPELPKKNLLSHFDFWKSNSRGFSLLEVLFSSFILAISFLAVAAFNSLSVQVNQVSKTKAGLLQVKSEIVGYLSDSIVWQQNVDQAGSHHPTMLSKTINKELACLNDLAIGCTAGTYPLTLLDRNGHIVADSVLTNTGYTRDGASCDTFTAPSTTTSTTTSGKSTNSPNSTVDSSCPFRFELAWQPICPLTGPCVRPQVLVSISLLSNQTNQSTLSMQIQMTTYQVVISQNKALPPVVKTITLATNAAGFGGTTKISTDLKSLIVGPDVTEVILDNSKNPTSQNGGAVTISGTTLTYDPPAKFHGVDTVYVTATDRLTGQSSASHLLVNVMTPHTWTGQGTDKLASNTQNWCGQVTSGVCDHTTFSSGFLGAKSELIFDGTCVSNCNADLNLAYSGRRIELSYDYSGTVTQKSSISLNPDLGQVSAQCPNSSCLSIQGGTFIGSTLSSDTLYVYGSVDVGQNGAFTAPVGKLTIDSIGTYTASGNNPHTNNSGLVIDVSSSRFAHSSGIIQVGSTDTTKGGHGIAGISANSGVKLNELILAKIDGGHYLFNDLDTQKLTLQGTNSQLLGKNTINVEGHVTTLDNGINGISDSSVTLSGSSAATVTCAHNKSFIPSLNISKLSTASVTFGNFVSVGYDLTYNSGVVVAGKSLLTLGHSKVESTTTSDLIMNKTGMELYDFVVGDHDSNVIYTFPTKHPVVVRGTLFLGTNSTTIPAITHMHKGEIDAYGDVIAQNGGIQFSDEMTSADRTKVKIMGTGPRKLNGDANASLPAIEIALGTGPSDQVQTKGSLRFNNDFIYTSGTVKLSNAKGDTTIFSQTNDKNKVALKSNGLQFNDVEIRSSMTTLNIDGLMKVLGNLEISNSDKIVSGKGFIKSLNSGYLSVEGDFTSKGGGFEASHDYSSSSCDKGLKIEMAGSNNSLFNIDNDGTKPSLLYVNKQGNARVDLSQSSTVATALSDADSDDDDDSSFEDKHSGSTKQLNYCKIQVAQGTLRTVGLTLDMTASSQKGRSIVVDSGGTLEVDTNTRLIMPDSGGRSANFVNNGTVSGNGSSVPNPTIFKCNHVSGSGSYK